VEVATAQQVQPIQAAGVAVAEVLQLAVQELLLCDI
jgi:hypothetical protein